jgi:succinate-semialdehyde dehydrogenase / glutarate-semialdehyde dehydrogenase
VVIKPGLADALLGAGAGRAGRARRHPEGRVNVVTGSAGEIGGELTGNPIVRKLSFTGSTEVGKLLMAQCAPT